MLQFRQFEQRRFLELKRTTETRRDQFRCDEQRDSTATHFPVDKQRACHGAAIIKGQIAVLARTLSRRSPREQINKRTERFDEIVGEIESVGRAVVLETKRRQKA